LKSAGRSCYHDDRSAVVRAGDQVCESVGVQILREQVTAANAIQQGLRRAGRPGQQDARFARDGELRAPISIEVPRGHRLEIWPLQYERFRVVAAWLAAME